MAYFGVQGFLVFTIVYIRSLIGSFVMMHQVCLDDGRLGTFVFSFQLYPDISPEIDCVYQNKQLYLS